jgi:hypothetical protein
MRVIRDFAAPDLPSNESIANTVGQKAAHWTARSSGRTADRSVRWRSKVSTEILVQLMRCRIASDPAALVMRRRATHLQPFKT